MSDDTPATSDYLRPADADEIASFFRSMASEYHQCMTGEQCRMTLDRDWYERSAAYVESLRDLVRYTFRPQEVVDAIATKHEQALAELNAARALNEQMKRALERMAESNHTLNALRHQERAKRVRQLVQTRRWRAECKDLRRALHVLCGKPMDDGDES